MIQRWAGALLRMPDEPFRTTFAVRGLRGGGRGIGVRMAEPGFRAGVIERLRRFIESRRRHIESPLEETVSLLQGHDVRAAGHGFALPGHHSH